MQQLQMAHDEYDEEATLFVFRLKSLKQGQSRSLLTQAARHHAAQVFFFSIIYFLNIYLFFDLANEGFALFSVQTSCASSRRHSGLLRQ